MLYIVAVVVLFPGSILALAAGAVFGLALGSLLVWTGTVLGQTLAFIIGRCDPTVLAVMTLTWHVCGLALSPRAARMYHVFWATVTPHMAPGTWSFQSPMSQLSSLLALHVCCALVGHRTEQKLSSVCAYPYGVS